MSNILIQTLKTESDRMSLAVFESLLDRQLTIPEYQRDYAWEKEHIVDLFKSIKDSHKVLMKEIEKSIDRYNEYCKNEKEQKKKFTFLGSIVFCVPRKNDENDDTSRYLIIDGQQRITTLLTILRFMQVKIQDIEEALKSEKNKNKEKNQDYSGHKQKLNEEIRRINKIIKKVSIKRENGSSKPEETDVLNYINGNKISSDKEEQIKTRIDKSIDESLEDAFEDNNFFGNDDRILESKFYISLIDCILEYILVCWIQIQGKDSSHFSIDLFNIMNSTGEPLTGFEIFKSKMIQKNKTDGQKIEKIREEISKEFKSDRKKILKHTGKLMLFLAIYRNDQKDKQTDREWKDNLSDREWKKQKKYIDLIFNNEDKLKDVCNDFHLVYNFYFNKWLKNNKKNQKIYNKEVGLCFKFLTDINHDRVLPILLMFTDSDQKKAIKICTAFSILWRVFHDGKAGGIDGVYLDISKKIKKENNITNLKKYLVEKLGEKGVTKKEWINKLVDIPIYNNHKRVTRFLLLVAVDKMTSQNGKIKNQRKSRGILKPHCWEEDEKYETIDHMVPQTGADSNSLKSVHVLGNLTFLPKKENSKLKNKDFQTRKKEFKKMIDPDGEDEYAYLPLLKEVCSEHGGGQEETDNRTQRMGEIIWETLAEDWLGWKD